MIKLILLSSYKELSPAEIQIADKQLTD